MFTPSDRQRVRDSLVERAKADPRIVASAWVGGSAEGEGDRWSDVDLALGLADGVATEKVLADWTGWFRGSHGAVRLFDLPHGPSIYRVFLLPGNLQVDLSFTPGSVFGARGPRFSSIFGSPGTPPVERPPADRERLGRAIHHLLRARISLERGRPWQADHWIAAARDEALALACAHRGLPTDGGRGLDRLPADVLEGASRTRASSTDAVALRAALEALGELLQRESPAVPELGPALERLRAAVAAARLS